MGKNRRSRKRTPRLPSIESLRRQAERDLARNKGIIESRPSGQGTPREGGRYG